MAKLVYDRINEKYSVNLDLDKMLWGSIAPDYLPYYKFKRHYLDESVDFISKEIANLVYFSRYSFKENDDSFVFTSYVSKKLGIIMHYLCDYVCYPHAYRMTFMGNMKSHIKYEQELNIYAKENKLREEKYSNRISEKNIDLYSELDIKLKEKVKSFILEVVEEYKNSEKGFDTDLDFALDFCTRICSFVIESALVYDGNFDIQFV
ncbi:zinc dependent phospholipase C family protein [Peptoniphilus sp.]|uniref:zinc dependent phospholipase C family protein n=1 Tax=Peptoniphilus sp. TaxID=1971214 RepID=UPI003D8FC40D